MYRMGRRDKLFKVLGSWSVYVFVEPGSLKRIIPHQRPRSLRPWEYFPAASRHLGRFRELEWLVSGNHLLPSSFIIALGSSLERPPMSSVDTPGASSGLPDDIWGEIAVELSAFDVFSLSQVRIAKCSQTVILKAAFSCVTMESITHPRHAESCTPPSQGGMCGSESSAQYAVAVASSSLPTQSLE
jgi:hypothetical protein